MDQPDGFVVPGQEGKVCKLLKSLYGLKQAPKEWHEKFERTLTAAGFVVNDGESVCTIAMVGVKDLYYVCMLMTYLYLEQISRSFRK